MIDQEKKQFAEIFKGVSRNYGKDATKEQMRLCWAALSMYTLEQVERAYTAHVMTDRFFPTIADIREIIESDNPNNQRPGPDEAWACVPRSDDDTVVWTEEMQTAWATAMHLVNPYMVEKPDWVAARMAFRDAYIRAVTAAKIHGKPVRWVVSAGEDKQLAAQIVMDAVRVGRITQEVAQHILLSADAAKPANFAGLLEGPKDSAKKEAAALAIQKLKAMLTRTKITHDLEQVHEELNAMEKNEKLK